MDEDGFRSFLERTRRSPAAVGRCLSHVTEFERWLVNAGGGTPTGDDASALLADFVADVESVPGASAKTHLWALALYYEFASEPVLKEICRELRRQRIDRDPAPLAIFGRADDAVTGLAGIGIHTTDQLLAAAARPEGRAALAARIGVTVADVTELAELSDLARIPGVKAVRARLYRNAGVGTVARLAVWDPEELRAHVAGFVAESGFAGIVPLPKEVAFTVATARRLAGNDQP